VTAVGDGRASETLALGIRAGAGAAERAPARAPSLLEVAARSAFIAGLVLVLGAGWTRAGDFPGSWSVPHRCGR
jgi:hypothetical protein